MATAACRRVVAALRDGTLENLSQEETARMKGHLAGCADCQRAAREYRGAETALQLHYERIPGPALTPAQRARFAATPAAPSRLGSVITAGALVALCAVVVALAATLSRGGIPQAAPGGPASATSGVAVPAVVCPMPAAPPAPAPPTPTQTAPGATATAIAAASQRPQVREDPCAMPIAGLVTLDEAAAALRAFLGEPATAFVGGYVPVSSGFGPQPSGYLVALQRLGATGPDDDRFNVDARSGEVSAANFRSRQGQSGRAGTPIAVDDARARAAAYAAAQQPTFARLTPRASSIAMIGAGSAEFTWQARDAVNGAWLPTWLRVAVSLDSGAVTGYAWTTVAYDGPTTPTLTAEEARARAEALVRDDPRYAGVTLDAPALEGYPGYAFNAAQGTPRLVWVFPYGERAAIYIDALTGEVIARSSAG